MDFVELHFLNPIFQKSFLKSQISSTNRYEVSVAKAKQKQLNFLIGFIGWRLPLNPQPPHYHKPHHLLRRRCKIYVGWRGTAGVGQKVFSSCAQVSVTAESRRQPQWGINHSKQLICLHLGHSKQASNLPFILKILGTCSCSRL